MRKLLLLPFLFFLLVGCSGNKDPLTIKEVDLDDTNSRVENFINLLSMNVDGKGNGIYLFNDSDTRSYLILRQDFLDDGKSFGKVDIKKDSKTLILHLNQSSKKGNKATQKIYEINNRTDTEILRVFKDGDLTHFQNVGT